MDLKQVGWESADWIYTPRERNKWQALVNMVIHLQVPQNAGNFFTS
jgi:hypothetical protein